MSWWEWVLIWIVLLVAALLFLFILLRHLWGKLKLLFAELSIASDRLAAVADELERLEQRQHTDPEPAAVFEDPSRLRAQRFAARTKQRGTGRRTRT